MNITTSSSPVTARRRNFLRGAVAGLTLAGLALLAHAAAPLVGTAIGNQASATYTDDSGTERTVLSNTVTTLVQQVYALDLRQDNTRTANPGGQVFFPHTVTNLGNGIDTFALAAINGGGATTLGNIVIYIDADGDGNPDNFTPITTTGPLAAGASFRFIVAATVPPGATLGNNGLVTVTATSPNGGGTPIVETNTDTATLTNDAVMQVTKAASLGSGHPGTATFTYTITYRNIGNTPASQFTITDAIPAGLAVGSARWSVSGSTVLDSATLPSSVAAGSIAYNAAGQNVTFVIGEVAAGVSGYVTVEVSVNAGVAPGILNNTAYYSFITGTDPDPSSPTPTNTVPFEVLPDVSLTFEGPPDPLPPVAAGGSVSFNNVLTNTGTGTDTFNVVVNGPGTFPGGTTFQLFKSDGATPLTDTNGDGVPDTGPVAAGATYTVVLRANIPGDAAATGTTLAVTKTATSTVDPTRSSTATDEIEGITGAGVDLTGVAGGSGPGTATVIDTVTGNPGSTVIFTLNVENTGPNPDTFNLLADKDGSFGTVNDLPSGWTVVFKDANGVVVSNTGVIAAGGTRTYTAEVTIPAGTPPGDVSVWFQSKSPTTGAADYLHDQVSVNTVRGITLQTNNVGQTFPGGSVVYEHVLTNTGNITEGASGDTNTLAIALADSLAGAGFTSVVYYDANNNGVIDAGDPIVDTSAAAYLSTVKTTGLIKGGSIRFLVKVQAPIGANDGAINVTTLTITPASETIGGTAAPAAVSNTDTTSVIRGNLTIVKEQSIDNGATWSQNQLSALPGAQILYRITVTNVGSATAEDIVVNDTIPANTTYDSGYTPTVTLAGASTPGAWALTGTNIVVTVGSLTPTQTAVVTFAVKIDE
ncbi:hypothetical protein OPIT5_20785 [Opitutaceae bacterium TAV5]|nr:hypothetical protein OPIT5_20785 [Opitutaceae bacterium TAV5]